jgi:hypothetical protein
MMRPLLFALLLSAPSLAQGADPAAAVNAFYAVYRAQPAHGIPDATGRLRYAPVLTPRLNKLLTDAAGTQAKMAARVKGAGPKAAVMPVLAGDIFTSFFDGASSWKIGGCTGDARVQRCAVVLSHAPNRPGEKPANWSDSVVVTSTPAGWKVDEVIYDPNYAFGNTGRLSDMLQMVIVQAP